MRCCNTLQHTATHCNTQVVVEVVHPNAQLQQTAVHCNTLQHTATHCNTQVVVEVVRPNAQLQHIVIHFNTLQCTATHCNTLQHTGGSEGSAPKCAAALRGWSFHIRGLLPSCSGMLQYVAVCCSVLQHDLSTLEAFCRLAQVCCSMMQCVAVCCSVL